jgi:hypothetical protein
MYIHPFVAGVLFTILAEIILLISVVVYKSNKKTNDE